MNKKISTVVLSMFSYIYSFSQLPQFDGWKDAGKVKPKMTSQIKSSNWIIGCETLDRDFANYDNYKTYLDSLGIRRIRLQGGWARTEKVKGQYNFQWLDHIINDATSRGLKPWLQLSYNNTLYDSTGTANLHSRMPSTPEALAAWDKWAEAMVKRYKSKVVDWEIWNEPDNNNYKTNPPQIAADLNLRTVSIIKRIQPEAKVSALSLGNPVADYAEVFLKAASEQGKLNLFDNLVYHGYVYNPDSHYEKVETLRAMVRKYSPTLRLRQGENGCPSRGQGGGALTNRDWNELSQAKWDARRLLGDLGRDIESSIFSIIDCNYTQGPINRLMVKGLIQSDSTLRVIRPKMAYHTVQNITSVFDDRLERIKEYQFKTTTNKGISVYGYKNKATNKQIATIWFNGDIPANTNAFDKIDVTISKGDFKNPVWVDVATGKIFTIPTSAWKKENNTYTFFQVPVYDGPILIADASLLR